MSKETGRKYGDKPSRPIYVWNGILEPKHRRRIGPAVWLFLYFIDRTTKERPNKNNPEEIEGWVYGKMPLTLERMAEETGIPERTISRYIVTLEGFDYIRTVRTPHGLIILVQKSSKWPNGKKGEKFAGLQRSAKSGESPAISGDSPAKSGECRKDKAVDLSGEERIRGHITAHSAYALPPSNSESQAQENCKPNPDTRLTLHLLARQKQMPRGKSQAELDQTRRELLLQDETLRREHPDWYKQPGKVVAFQKEATA